MVNFDFSVKRVIGFISVFIVGYIETFISARCDAEKKH